MAATISSSGNERSKTEFTIAFALVAVIGFFIATATAAYLNVRVLSRDATLVMHTHDVILELDNVASFMKDAETGQRGYILTGKDSYLQPFTEAQAAINASLEHIKQLTIDNPEQQQRIPVMQEHIHAKLAELQETIEMRRTKGFDAALAVITTDHGKKEMDLFRAQADEMQIAESNLRSDRLDEMNKAYRNAIVSGIFSGTLGILLSVVVAYLVRRSASPALWMMSSASSPCGRRKRT